MAELSSNSTGGKGVQVETEDEKFTVMCSRSRQNLELTETPISRCLLANNPKAAKVDAHVIFLHVHLNYIVCG